MRALGRGRVGGVAIAQIGPLTAVIEALATAVGAGAVIGSAAAGICGLWAHWPTPRLERRTLYGSYLGGAVGAASALFDAIVRYGIMK
jgi:hypothetical protein